MENSRTDLSAEEAIRKLKEDRRKTRLDVLRWRMEALERAKGGRVAKDRELCVVDGKLGYKKLGMGGEKGADTVGHAGQGGGEKEKDVSMLDNTSIVERDLIHVNPEKKQHEVESAFFVINIETDTISSRNGHL